MKYLVLFFLLIGFQVCISQEVVLDFKCNQKSKQIKKRTYSLSNSLNNDLAVLIREKKRVYAYLFDENFNSKREFTFDSSKKKKYNALLGDKISNSKYSLLYSNSIHNRFCVLTIDFNSKSSNLKEIELAFRNERYLKTVNHQNRLYVLSTTIDNEIIIRELNDNYEFQIINTQILQLDKKQKLHTKDFRYNGFWSTLKSNIIKIDNRIPNSIEHASEDNKIYKQDGNLFLTFDNKTESTLMYVISLTDFTVERKEFAYPTGKLDDFKRHNSYFIDNILFQIASSNKEITLVAKKLDGSILQSYYFDKETPINIKNSTIVQDGATALPFVTKREFEETSKFLRKISSGKVGMSGYLKDNSYHFTIGGVKETVRSGPMMMPMYSTTTLSNNVQITMVSYNPVFSSYNSYSTTKSTFFKTKFDLGFNYIKDNVVNSNIFDQIEEYSDSLKYISGEDVFYHKDQLLFGYFSMKEGQFKLVRF